MSSCNSKFPPDRDLAKLEENFRYKVRLFLSKVGDIIFVTEAFREGVERQQCLFHNKPKLSWLDGINKKSNHQIGKAIDIAFQPEWVDKNTDGSGIYPSDMNLWNMIFDVAEECGMHSLFRLRGVDKPHLECDGSIVPRYLRVMIDEVPRNERLFKEHNIKDPYIETKSLIEIAMSRK